MKIKAKAKINLTLSHNTFHNLHKHLFKKWNTQRKQCESDLLPLWLLGGKIC